MNTNDLRELLRRMPFKPLRLHLTNGLTYDIQHPEFAMVGRSYVLIELPSSHSPLPHSERRTIITLLHIVRIEFLEQPVLPSNN
jgi:hypothetical protein